MHYSLLMGKMRLPFIDSDLLYRGAFIDSDLLYRGALKGRFDCIMYISTCMIILLE